MYTIKIPPKTSKHGGDCNVPIPITSADMKLLEFYKNMQNCDHVPEKQTASNSKAAKPTSSMAKKCSVEAPAKKKSSPNIRTPKGKNDNKKSSDSERNSGEKTKILQKKNDIKPHAGRTDNFQRTKGSRIRIPSAAQLQMLQMRNAARESEAEYKMKTSQFTNSPLHIPTYRPHHYEETRKLRDEVNNYKHWRNYVGERREKLKIQRKEERLEVKRINGNQSSEGRISAGSSGSMKNSDNGINSQNIEDYSEMPKLDQCEDVPGPQRRKRVPRKHVPLVIPSPRDPELLRIAERDPSTTDLPTVKTALDNHKEKLHQIQSSRPSCSMHSVNERIMRIINEDDEITVLHKPMSPVPNRAASDQKLISGRSTTPRSVSLVGVPEQRQDFKRSTLKSSKGGIPSSLKLKSKFTVKNETQLATQDFQKT